MARRNYRGYYDDNIQGTIKYSRTSDGKMLGFLTKVKSKSKKVVDLKNHLLNLEELLHKTLIKLKKD